MPFQLLFWVLENTEELCDQLQSHCLFFTLLIFGLVFWPSDGTTQALGTCLRDFRNKPYPIRAKITYYKKTLTVRKNNVVFQTKMIPVKQSRPRPQRWVISTVSQIVVLSPGDDQQRLHSKQRRLWVLHQAGQHDHSHRRLLWNFGCHRWFGR